MRMGIISCNYHQYRLGRQFASNGFGDLRVLIGGEEIRSSKAVFMISNTKMREIIERSENGNIIELFEECSIEAFFELEKYYSGGYMNININNVCEILSMCIYYNEKRIIPICLKFIKNHLYEEILINLIKIIHIYDDEEDSRKELKEIMEIIYKYINKNGYKLLKEEYINELELKDVKMILKEMKYVKNNENWLFKVLFKWYKNEKKKYKREKNEKREFEKEYIELMKNAIDFAKIKMELLKPNEIEFINNNINLGMSNRKEEYNYSFINIEKIKEKEIEEIILKYYIEKEIITIEERDIEILENLNINNINKLIIMLLKNEDIKMKEIGMMLILDSKIQNEKIYELIDKEEISKIIFLLSNEYKKILNEYEHERIYKSFCLFVDDVEYIVTINNLCGIEILYHILNYHYYLSKDSKELLINYIKCQKANENEYERMIKILNNEVILSEFIDKLTYFSYPSSAINVYGDFSIKPKYDGSMCLFSINPSLPQEIILNTNTREINGKIDKKIDQTEYTVKCENILNKLEYKISFVYERVIYSEEFKRKEITISNNGKTITNNNNNSYFRHCFINLKMENGIYHFKYKFMRNKSAYNAIKLALSTDNTYSGNSLYNQSTTCNYCAWSGKSQDITKRCHIGTVVTSNPNFNNCGDGSIYEVIVDMNKREFSICHNNSSPVLLVKDLPSPLYPCAKPGSKGCSIELLSFSHYE